MSTKAISIVEFRTKILRDTIIRPANTTAYAAGDVIARADDSGLVFSRAAQAGPLSGSIEYARLHSSANQSTKGAFALLLFHTEPTLTPDNASLALTDAEAESLVGIINFAADAWFVTNAGAGAAGSCVNQVNGIGIPFRADGVNPDPADIRLYGVLVANGAYTPVSGEQFTLALGVYQD